MADTYTKTRICPDCCAENPPDVPHCWLCYRPLTPPIEMAAPKPLPTPHLAGPTVAGRVLWVFLLLALINVGVGLLLAAPGLGVVFVILVTPVMVRMFMGNRAERSDAQSPATTIGTFFIILGMIVTVGVAALVAFYVTCLP